MNIKKVLFFQRTTDNPGLSLSQQQTKAKDIQEYE